ncbi:DUF3035 domain-containing protein [Maribius pontilimi]|uniref:DUF3035 domain-containing protein n=1 Tax=Palleronia pontilimi TaxID=1964209 RepID=A0A934IBM5_9RHOB|nr:DUF3035 domain-containing protein [Palleronia pontilimi]MBJ3764124.1 DUF3035 domain-containing protein [Palleronia pontilimi]
MRGAVTRYIAALGLSLGLSACGGTPDLITLRKDGPGPDEFAVLPNKPLQTPANLNALPPPTPGGANRTDATPQADAIAALGGRASAVQGGGVQGPALVSHARRFGVDSSIRQTLAAEDLAFRRDNDGRLLERVLNVTTYYNAYRGQSLDQYAELERFRRAGVRTPAVPPPNVEQ